MTKRPELLSPAGDMERLDMALRYGADAVYLAGTQFGMRGGVKNFTPDELAEAVRRCHGQNVRVHVTVNTLPRTDELAALPDYLRLLESIGVDALIIADMGVLRLAKRYAPTPEKHISTQAGIVNAESALGWMELGASRVVLARELSLDEIRAIRRAVPPELELETFIHGSMCVSFSGRCLLSNYMTGRDAQRGVCAQPCRWKYALMEQTRPGEYFPVYEEDGGTYIMNSRDMCMIEHIPELIEAGIDSFKIEGRAKSSYYTAVVTNAYQRAITAAMEGQPLDPVWLDEVNKVSHRNYCTGFYYGDDGHMQYYDDARYLRDWQVAAYVLSCDAAGNALLTQRNRFCAGEMLELLPPGEKPVRFAAENICDEEGQPLTVCPHPEMRFYMKLPCWAPKGSILRRETKPAEK